jgi:hypothetical protein
MKNNPSGLCLFAKTSARINFYQSKASPFAIPLEALRAS